MKKLIFFGILIGLLHLTSCAWPKKNPVDPHLSHRYFDTSEMYFNKFHYHFHYSERTLPNGLTTNDSANYYLDLWSKYAKMSDSAWLFIEHEH